LSLAAQKFGTGRRLFALGTGSANGPVISRIRVLVLFDRAQCTSSEFNLAAGIEATMRLAWERNMQHGNFEVVFTCANTGASRYRIMETIAVLQRMPLVHQIRQKYGGDLLLFVSENTASGAPGVGTQPKVPSRNAITVVQRSYLTQIPSLCVHEIGHNFGMSHDRYNAWDGHKTYCNLRGPGCNYGFKSNFWRSIM
jgi:hypothetical protein